MPKHANTVRLHLLCEVATLVVGLCETRERAREKGRVGERLRGEEEMEKRNKERQADGESKSERMAD